MDGWMDEQSEQERKREREREREREKEESEHELLRHHVEGTNKTHAHRAPPEFQEC